MLPARFEYHRPESVDGALSLLAEHGEDAKVLAGGMSLIPLMKLRFASPPHVVDVNGIPGLDAIGESGGELRVGALARHNQIVASDVIATSYPAMAAAAPQISDPIVRNRGTLGGSLAHADPQGDWGAVMLALGASVVARSAAGERTIPIDDFLVDTFTTALRPDELLVEVRIPAPAGRAGGAYLKMERKVGDFATVGVAVHVSLDDGRIGSAGIGMAAVGSKNMRAAEAEAALAGAEPTGEAFAEAGRLAAAAANPTSDVRGSAEYKRHVVDVYVRRGLARAIETAGGVGA